MKGYRETYDLYMELLIIYYREVYTSNILEQKLTRIHATGRMSEEEYQEYIPRLKGRIQALATVLERNQYRDLDDLAKI